MLLAYLNAKNDYRPVFMLDNVIYQLVKKKKAKYCFHQVAQKY